MTLAQRLAAEALPCCCKVEMIYHEAQCPAPFRLAVQAAPPSASDEERELCRLEALEMDEWRERGQVD